MHLHVHCENVARVSGYVNARALAGFMQSQMLVLPGNEFDVLGE